MCVCVCACVCVCVCVVTIRTGRSGFCLLVYLRILCDSHNKQATFISLYSSVSQTFFKWGPPLSLVRMFYGPPYSWDYQTH